MGSAYAFIQKKRRPPDFPEGGALQILWQDNYRIVIVVDAGGSGSFLGRIRPNATEYLFYQTPPRVVK